MNKPRIQKGPIVRTRKMEKQYIHHRKYYIQDGCDFCHFADMPQQVAEEYPLFWVVINKFPYAVWDGCRVLEHLLISPKRHVTSISEYDASEKTAYMEIVADYEKRGYCLYSRPHGGITKSVPHQHTHFIKIENKRITKLVYSHSPHVLLYK